MRYFATWEEFWLPILNRKQWKGGLFSLKNTQIHIFILFCILVPEHQIFKTQWVLYIKITKSLKYWHNDTGYCKFGEQFQKRHFHTICMKTEFDRSSDRNRKASTPDFVSSKQNVHLKKRVYVLSSMILWLLMMMKPRLSKSKWKFQRKEIKTWERQLNTWKRVLRQEWELLLLNWSRN